MLRVRLLFSAGTVLFLKSDGSTVTSDRMLRGSHDFLTATVTIEQRRKSLVLQFIPVTCHLSLVSLFAFDVLFDDLTVEDVDRAVSVPGKALIVSDHTDRGSAPV
jgi:hypothetical protein